MYDRAHMILSRRIRDKHISHREVKLEGRMEKKWLRKMEVIGGGGFQLDFFLASP